MTMNPQFFRRTDLADVPGPPRELTGYGEHPPRVRWQNNAKVAVQIVVNYEEGSEKTFAMGDQVNDGMYELPFAVDDQRLRQSGAFLRNRKGLPRPIAQRRR